MVESVNAHDDINIGRSSKTIGNIKQSLTELLKYCEENRWIDVNVAETIQLPQAKKRPTKIVKNVIDQSEYSLVMQYLYA